MDKDKFDRLNMPVDFALRCILAAEVRREIDIAIRDQMLSGNDTGLLKNEDNLLFDGNQFRNNADIGDEILREFENEKLPPVPKENS